MTASTFMRASHIVVLVAAFFSVTGAKAQTKYWDVIMLKDAEVIRGTITDSIPATSVTILAGDSLSRTVARDSIQLITKEVRRKAYTQQSQWEDKDYSELVYYRGILGAGFGFGLGTPGSFKINFVNSFEFYEVVSFGFGVGVRLPFENEGIVLPLFLDIRARLMRSRVAPFIALGIGMCFQPDQDFDNTGGIIAPEIGISIKKSGKSNVMLTVGFESFDIYNSENRQSFNTIHRYTISDRTNQNIKTLTLNLAIGF